MLKKDIFAVYIYIYIYTISIYTRISFPLNGDLDRSGGWGLGPFTLYKKQGCNSPSGVH